MRCTPFTPVSNALPGKAGLTFKLFTLLHISWIFSNSKVPSSRTTFSKYIKTWLFHLKVQRPRAAFANPNCVFLLPVLEILPEGFWTPGTSPCCFSSVGIYSVRLWNSSRWRPARLSPREANCVTIWGRFVFPGGMCARSSGAPGWRHCARPAPQLPPLCGWTSAKAALWHPKTQGAGGRAREGLGTGTYQCEPEPEFSSAVFRKAFWRLLDILDGWEGTGQGGVWGQGPQPRREPESVWDRSHWGACCGRQGAWPKALKRAAFPASEGSGCGRRKTQYGDRALPDAGRFRPVSGPRDASEPVRADAGGGPPMAPPPALPPRRRQRRRGAGDRAQRSGQLERASEPLPRPTALSRTVTKENGSLWPRPYDVAQSPAKVDVSSSGSKEESKEKVLSLPTRNKIFPGSVVDGLFLCVHFCMPKASHVFLCCLLQ